MKTRMRGKARGVATPGRGLRIGIYTRVSDPDEENNEGSHEFQQAPCRAYAAENGYAVHDTYVDNFSGRYLHERPGLSRLRQDVRDGKIDAIVVWKLDRLSRNRAQRAVLIEELRDHGCRYFSATEEISDTPEGRLLEGMLEVLAEFEIERTLERSSEGLAILRRKGQPICAGLARYGYRYDVERRRREVVEDEAEWVRRIYAWYLAGLSVRAIAARLNAPGGPPCPAQSRGVKLGGSPRWNTSTLLAILHDESYAGAPMVSGKKRSTSDVSLNGHARSERTDPSEWWTTKDGTPPIIDRTTFDRVQALAKTRTTYHNARNEAKPFLLRGMVECAVCGRTMSPAVVWNRRGGKVYDYYVCNSKDLGGACGNGATPVAWLDRVVWAEVLARLADRKAVEEQFARLLRETRSEDIDRDLDGHARGIEEARAAIRRVMLRLEATDDREILDPLEERLAELRKVIAGHKAESAVLEGKLLVIRNQRAALDRWLEACDRGRGRLESESGTSLEQRRLLLQSLDLRAVARKKEVEVRFGIPFVDEDDSPGRADHIHKPRLTFQFAVTG